MKRPWVPQSSALFMALCACLACADSPQPDAAPADAAPALSTVEGDCGEVHGATVCTWARLEGERVVATGATIPLAAVEGADPEAPFVWPPVSAATIALPPIVQEQYGITDLKVYWESHGHPPAPYMVPHFDFHFYFRPAGEILAIDCSDERKPDNAPAGYALPDMEIPDMGTLVGTCVPEMGMHALPAAELESDQPFDGTMVIGYYATEPIFLEPMISQALLMEQQSFALDMPEIPGLDSNTVQPTRFEAVFDAATATYEFQLSGFPRGQ